MQTGYVYYLTEPPGRNFAPDFRPELTPKEMLALGVFGGKYMADRPRRIPGRLVRAREIERRTSRRRVSITSASTRRNHLRRGDGISGFVRRIPEAGSSGTVVTTWAGGRRTMCARSGDGARSRDTWRQFESTASPATSSAAGDSGRPCSTGPTTAVRFRRSAHGRSSRRSSPDPDRDFIMPARSGGPFRRRPQARLVPDGNVWTIRGVGARVSGSRMRVRDAAAGDATRARETASVRLLTVKTGVDLTDSDGGVRERRVAELSSEDLSGYVLKKDSPSCGLERVKIYDAQGVPERSGQGLFASRLAERFRDSADRRGRAACRIPRLRENFVERVFAYWRLRGLFSGRWNLGALVRFHTAHKLVLMAHSPDAYQRLGPVRRRTRGRSRAKTSSGAIRRHSWRALTVLATPPPARERAAAHGRLFQGPARSSLESGTTCRG